MFWGSAGKASRRGTKAVLRYCLNCRKWVLSRHTTISREWPNGHKLTGLLLEKTLAGYQALERQKVRCSVLVRRLEGC